MSYENEKTGPGQLVEKAADVTWVRVTSVTINDGEKVTPAVALEFKESQDAPLFRMTFTTPAEFQRFAEDMLHCAGSAWPGDFGVVARIPKPKRAGEH